MQKGNVNRGILLSLLVFLTSLYYNDPALSQEKQDAAACPTPYIKIIKPKLAQPGQEIIIRGHRFGIEEESGDVIFPPGLVGRIIDWSHNRIRVEVPPGAETGAVVVKTKCATSNGNFLKIGSETEKSTSGGIQEWN